jgi:hypothetical protein
MWFVHCMTKDFATRLMPILDGLPLGVLDVDSGETDTHVKITTSEDVANVIHDAGFHVVEA